MATLFTSQLPWMVHLHVLARSLTRHFCPFSVSLISSPYFFFSFIYIFILFFSWIHFTLEAWFYVALLTVWRRLLKIISENNPAREWWYFCCCSLHINSLLPAYLLHSALFSHSLFLCSMCIYIKFYLYAHVCFFLWRCIFQHNKY